MRPAIVCDRVIKGGGVVKGGVRLNGVRDEAGSRHSIKDRHPKILAEQVGVGWELAALTEYVTNRLALSC